MEKFEPQESPLETTREKNVNEAEIRVAEMFDENMEARGTIGRKRVMERGVQGPGERGF